VESQRDGGDGREKEFPEAKYDTYGLSLSHSRVYTKPFVLTSLAYLCFFTNVSAYNLLPLYLQALGARAGEIGTIMAMYSGAAILGQAVTGRLLDRGWRKPCLLAAASLLTAVSAAFGATTHLGWLLYLLRFLQGLGFAVYMTSSLTLIADLAPPARRAEAVGIYGTGGLVAVALGPALGEGILQAWGFPAFFAATVLMGAATLVLAATVPAPPTTPAVRGPRLGWAGWAPFLPVLLPGFQYGLANTIVFVFLPPFARLLGLPRVGPFYIAYTGAAILVRFVGGGLADRVGRERVILPALGAMTAGILLCSGLHATWLLVAIGLLNGTAQGFVMPAANALAFERAPSGRRGQAVAFYTGANLVGATLGASGFGWMVQAFGYRPAFVLASGVLALGTWAFWRQR
jgi:MFS family permease